MQWRLGILLLLVPFSMSAQQRTRAQESAEDTYLAKVNAFERQARTIAEAELRRKLGVNCGAGKMGEQQPNDCASHDEDAADKVYKEVFRLLSESFALADPAADPHSSLTPLKHFQAAEEGWQTYRTNTCAALGDSLQRGNARGPIEAGCRLDVTRTHLKELEGKFFDD